MLCFLKERYDALMSFLWHRRIRIAIKDTNDVLLYMDADEAVKWIDNKINEGEELKKECDDKDLNEFMDKLFDNWRRIRIKRMWEIAHKK